MSNLAKIQGYTVLSPSDPNRQGMLFATREAAESHAENMTRYIDLWGSPDELWDKSYWGETKPEPWEIYDLHAGDRII